MVVCDFTSWCCLLVICGELSYRFVTLDYSWFALYCCGLGFEFCCLIVLSLVMLLCGRLTVCCLFIVVLDLAVGYYSLFWLV